MELSSKGRFYRSRSVVALEGYSIGMEPSSINIDGSQKSVVGLLSWPGTAMRRRVAQRIELIGNVGENLEFLNA